MRGRVQEGPFPIIFAPMAFKEIIGQGAVKSQLTELVQQNRLSHALLFLGPEGSGALALALAFAQYMVCEKVHGAGPKPAAPGLFGEPAPGKQELPEKWEDACGLCPACAKARQMVHPDIHFSYPVIPKKTGDKPLSTDFIAEWREFVSKHPYGNVYDWLQFIGAENKQGNITAHECNDIIHKLSLKSFESEYKLLIMWMPEYLGNEGNKLLKLIEEPPPNTLFILVAENESLILQTILSRTQLVKIPALETPDISGALIQRNGISPEQAGQVASISEGNYHEALQLLQHADEDWFGLLREWLNAILKTGPSAQVKWIEEVSKMGRERQKQFLRYFNHILEQAIRLSVLDGLPVPMTEKEKEFTLRLNRLTGIAEQQEIIREIDRATYFIERNANAKMLFHALTIKIYHIIAHKTVATML